MVRKSDLTMSQGIGFEIRVNVGVPKEKYLEIENAIATILLQDNDRVQIHPVGHYNKNFNKVIHRFENDKEMETYYAQTFKD